MNIPCPACGYKFKWLERRQFTTWHLSRREGVCPNCRARLTWDKLALPCYLGGSLGLMVGMCVFAKTIPWDQLDGITNPKDAITIWQKSESATLLGWASFICIIIGSGVAAFGFARFRLVLSQTGITKVDKR